MPTPSLLGVQAHPSNRDIGRTEIKRLCLNGMTLRAFVDELRRLHPIEGFEVKGGTAYIMRLPGSNEPLPVEFVFE